MDVAGAGARMLQNRRFARAPIWFFRHRLGWLFGGRIVMLEHLGRRSGEPRFVCLELVARPNADTIVVASGFAERSQWYQNLRAHPDCYVTVGRHRTGARARFMTAEEAGAVLVGYQQEHPRSWERLRNVIERAVGHPVESLPMVELNLLGEH